jgi:hypothetical protein
MKFKIPTGRMSTLSIQGMEQIHMQSLHTSALSNIKSSLKLLEKHCFAVSRAAIIVGKKEISSDLADLDYEDLRHLRSNFNSLVEILRTLHEHVLPLDPDTSKEVLLACSEAIMGRADTESARRIRKSGTNRTNSTALISAIRSTLLRIRATLRRLGGIITPSVETVEAAETKKDAGVVETEVVKDEGSRSITPLVDDSQTVADAGQNEDAETSIPEDQVQLLVSAAEEIQLNAVKTEQSTVSILDRSPQRDMRELTSIQKHHYISEMSDTSTKSAVEKQSLEERCTALRRATAVTSPRRSVDTTDSDSTTTAVITPDLEKHLIGVLLPQTSTTSETKGELGSGRSKDNPILLPPSTGKLGDTSTGDEITLSEQKANTASHRTRTTDRSSGVYLKELSKHEYSKMINNADTHEIVEFTVMGPDYRPVSKLAWFSKASRNFSKKEESVKGLIRRHVAEKLNADPRSLGLFYGHKTPSKSRILVRIMLDPYIRLALGHQTFVLDFTRHYFNKACLTVGELRAQAKARIAEKRQHSIHLFIDFTPLRDDSVKLKDTGLLSDRVLQGWEPLVIQVSVEIEVKDCMVCGDELPFHKFPMRIASKCTHREVNTCHKCVKTWIKTTLVSKGFDKITCPECKATLQHADVKARAGKRTFEKYDMFQSLWMSLSN